MLKRESTGRMNDSITRDRHVPSRSEDTQRSTDSNRIVENESVHRFDDDGQHTKHSEADKTTHSKYEQSEMSVAMIKASTEVEDEEANNDNRKFQSEESETDADAAPVKELTTVELCSLW